LSINPIDPSSADLIDPLSSLTELVEDTDGEPVTIDEEPYTSERRLCSSNTIEEPDTVDEEPVTSGRRHSLLNNIEEPNTIDDASSGRIYSSTTSEDIRIRQEITFDSKSNLRTSPDDPEIDLGPNPIDSEPNLAKPNPILPKPRPKQSNPKFFIFFLLRRTHTERVSSPSYPAATLIGRGDAKPDSILK
jgi:hypothetical protein